MNNKGYKKIFLNRQRLSLILALLLFFAALDFDVNCSSDTSYVKSARDEIYERLPENSSRAAVIISRNEFSEHISALLKPSHIRKVHGKKAVFLWLFTVAFNLFFITRTDFCRPLVTAAFRKILDYIHKKDGKKKTVNIEPYLI